MSKEQPLNPRGVYMLFGPDEKEDRSMPPVYREQSRAMTPWPRSVQTYGPKPAAHPTRTYPAVGTSSAKTSGTTGTSYYNYNMFKPNRALTEAEKKAAEERKKYTTFGLCGLRNLGNTCYMNSTLQSLNCLEIFRSMLIGMPLEDNQYGKKGRFYRTYENSLRRNTKERLKIAYRKENDLGEYDVVNLPKKVVNQACRHTMTHRTRQLFRKMWHRNKILVPRKLRRYIRVLDSDFGTSRQQDAEELLSKLLDAIAMEIADEGSSTLTDVTDKMTSYLQKRDDAIKGIITKEEFEKYQLHNPIQKLCLKAFNYWRNYLQKSTSLITLLFTGLYLSTVKCNECNYLSGHFEPFNVLSLPIKEQHGYYSREKIEDAFKNFTKSEFLTGGNKWLCPHCKDKRDAHKTMYVYHMPEILIIQLKRFCSDMYGRQRKIDSMVTYPINGLKIKDITSPLHKDESLYDLQAVTYHHGSLQGGHYTARGRNNRNNQWYKFDDSHVFHIPEDKLADALVDKDGYILFYQRRRDPSSYETEPTGYESNEDIDFGEDSDSDDSVE